MNTLYTYTYTNICTPLHVRSTGQPELEFDSKLRKVVIKKKKKKIGTRVLTYRGKNFLLMVSAGSAFQMTKL